MSIFDSETMSDCSSAQLVCLSCPAFTGCQAGNRQLELMSDTQLTNKVERHANGSVTTTQTHRRILTLRKR